MVGGGLSAAWGVVSDGPEDRLRHRSAAPRSTLDFALGPSPPLITIYDPNFSILASYGPTSNVATFVNVCLGGAVVTLT